MLFDGNNKKKFHLELSIRMFSNEKKFVNEICNQKAYLRNFCHI